MKKKLRMNLIQRWRLRKLCEFYFDCVNLAFFQKTTQSIQEVNNCKYKLIGIGELFGCTVEFSSASIVFLDKNSNRVYSKYAEFNILDSIDPDEVKNAEAKEIPKASEPIAA